jgi:hypothetical protein
MTTKQGKILIEPFQKQAIKDGDPFITCHFSRSEAKFAGAFEGLDQFDAMIVIKKLVQHFEIDQVLLNTAL